MVDTLSAVQWIEETRSQRCKLPTPIFTHEQRYRRQCIFSTYRQSLSSVLPNKTRQNKHNLGTYPLFSFVSSFSTPFRYLVSPTLRFPFSTLNDKFSSRGSSREDNGHLHLLPRLQSPRPSLRIIEGTIGRVLTVHPYGSEGLRVRGLGNLPRHYHGRNLSIALVNPFTTNPLTLRGTRHRPQWPGTNPRWKK